MPHVVRRLDLDDLNIRPVDIGTQNVVEVRHIAAVAPATAAPAATVPSGVAEQHRRRPAAPAPAPNPACRAPGAVERQRGTVATAQPSRYAGAPRPTRPGAEPGPADGEPANGSDVRAQCDSERRAECVQRAGADQLRSEGDAVGECFQRRGAVQGWRGGGAGASGRCGQRYAAGFADEAAGIGRSYALRAAVYADRSWPRRRGRERVSVGKAVLLDPNNASIDASGSQAIVNVR